MGCHLLPIDFHNFQDGYCTTNQLRTDAFNMYHTTFDFDFATCMFGRPFSLNEYHLNGLIQTTSDRIIGSVAG